VKDCEEDEYTLKPQYREQGKVRACMYASEEWALELQGEGTRRFL